MIQTIREVDDNKKNIRRLLPFEILAKEYYASAEETTKYPNRTTKKITPQMSSNSSTLLFTMS